METHASYHPVLFDLGLLSASQTDSALEAIYKAQSDEPIEQSDIWEPHHSAFLRDLIERCTQHGLDRIDAIRTELSAWASGERHSGTGERLTRPGLHPRWSPDELNLVRLYLQHLPPSEWTLEDWMLATEAAFQQHLPAEFAWEEADWLTKRAVTLGRVAAQLPEINERLAQAIVDADTLPTPYEQALQSAVTYGRARAAENITQASDSLRHRIKRVLIDHAEAEALNAPPQNLQQKLMDACGEANRDWRKIAVTEAVEMHNQGMVAAQTPGTVLRRFEQYRNVCAWCAKIHGLEVTVVPADQPFKDGEKMVWVGKTNLGRSAAPRKRVGQYLVPREPDERYWPAAGAQHPHCRGGWTVVKQIKGSGDDEFDAWVRAKLAEVK